MKTSRYIAASAILFASLGLPTAAFAQKYNQTEAFSSKDNAWEVAPTAPFSSFGNWAGIGDCQYETAANLTLAEFPKTKISTAEVVSAFNRYGDLWQGTQVQQSDGSWLNQGLWAGQNFLISQGFGHRASISQAVTLSQMVYGANHGGLEVSITGPNLMHMLGIIHANAKEMTVVDDGVIYHYTWTGFTAKYEADGSALAFYAVTWS